MRAISLHRDVIVVTSAILRVNCAIVRGTAGEEGQRPGTPEPADEAVGTPDEAEQPDAGR